MKEHTAVKSQLDELLSQKEELEEKNQALSSQIEQMNTSLATFQEAAKGSDDDVQAIVARLQLQVNDLTVQLETSHKDEEEYIGCESLTTAFLAVVHKYVYLFRLCKNSEI